MRSIELRLFTTAGLAALALACGGSKAPPGAPTKNPNAPEWVFKGSRIEKGRIIGVGMAGGIQNTELARETAVNRGRAEISKMLEVYSASLMKDYSASTSADGASAEEQRVESAIKTFSANLLKGTEPKGYWKDETQNAWFAQVELDFEKSRAIAAADIDGKGKTWIEDNGGRVLDDMADKEPPPPPPPADDPPPSAPPPAAPPPAADPGPETVVGGPQPDWTTGKCDRARFLCGVGSGKDRTSADLDARAELARIFKANITAVASSFETASSQISSKTGETWTETQDVSRFSMVSTEKVVTMSEIVYRWDDGKGTKWTLAVIDRAKAGNALRDQIEAKDSVIRAKVGSAKGTDDKLARFKALKVAVAALAEREALNSDLRVIDSSGRGIPPPHDIGAIVGMLDAATSSLKIGIAISGTASDRVQSCLEEAMTAKGYEVAANSSEDEDEDEIDLEGEGFDVMIKGKVKAEKRGAIAGSEVVNTSLTLKLINAKTNKVIKTYTASKKASRGDVKAAASTSVHQLCTQKVTEIAAEIDRAFSR
jgi:hypothetical protein